MKYYKPWYSASCNKNIPEVVDSIIKIQKGSKGKCEADQESGLFRLDRVLFIAVYYSVNYGFIHRTFCDDRDPLNILIICSVEVDPFCVETKVIGAMHMIISIIKLSRPDTPYRGGVLSHRMARLFYHP
jgi:inorganic pyrophosphatase